MNTQSYFSHLSLLYDVSTCQCVPCIRKKGGDIKDQKRNPSGLVFHLHTRYFENFKNINIIEIDIVTKIFFE